MIPQAGEAPTEGAVQLPLIDTLERRLDALKAEGWRFVFRGHMGSEAWGDIVKWGPAGTKAIHYEISLDIGPHGSRDPLWALAAETAEAVDAGEDVTLKAHAWQPGVSIPAAHVAARIEAELIKADLRAAKALAARNRRGLPDVG